MNSKSASPEPQNQNDLGKRPIAREVAAKRSLLVWPSDFQCPYCEKVWPRPGGHSEGFVKASAMRHVRICWEVALYRRGYGVIEDGTGLAIPLSELDAVSPGSVSRLRAHDRKRTKAAK